MQVSPLDDRDQSVDTTVQGLKPVMILVFAVKLAVAGLLIGNMLAPGLIAAP